MHPLTTGKKRRLQQCATAEGHLVVLAVDHRVELRPSLEVHHPGDVPDEALVEFKRDVVAALAPAASAVLLDPEYGAGPCIEAGALPGDRGLVLAIERSGYRGSPAARVSEVLPGWEPQRAVQVGANSVKLLVFYHPQAPTAPQTEALVRETAEACAAADVPFFLEPLTYSPDPDRPHLSPSDRRRAVIETARRLTAIPGVDVLKAEFPLDVAAEPDEGAWLEACQDLTAASRVPWVLLSAGVGIETFLHQVAAAGRAGACGVAVGRAVWKEATDYGTAAGRRAFLQTEARTRMARVAAVCHALAWPWYEAAT